MVKKKYVLIDRRQPTRYITDSETTGIVKVFDYIIGLGVFGALYYLLNPIADLFNATITAENEAFVMMIWSGSLIIYLIFGAFWFLNSLREWNGRK